MYTIILPTFEGPLDLLLRLIERAELDITTIALAEVTDQYLAHVRALDDNEIDPRAVAEFVSMAARLLLIKSRALLPRPAAAGRAESEDADAEALARQLREYQRYKQAARLLREWQETDRRMFLRTAPVPLPPAVVEQRLAYSVADLIAAIERRLQLRLPFDVPDLLALPPRRTVAEVAGDIRERLRHAAWFSFEDLLDQAATRQDVIVAFWAVLELLKRGVVTIEQDGLFGTISVGRGAHLLTSVTLNEDEL